MNNIKAEYKEIESFDEGIIFKLPGEGESRVDCGTDVHLGHLDGDSWHWVHRKKSCHRKECPICWPDWQKREAMAIRDRILAYFESGYSPRRMPVHYVLSPPQSSEYSTKESFRRLKRRAYKVGKERGIGGGCLIFHERAKRYSDSEEYENAHCSQGPHFHVIGDGWLSPRVKEFFLKDGWVVKNLRIRKLSHIYKTAFYVLDHSAIGYPAISQSKNLPMAVVTWFGSMSYNKLRIEKFKGSDLIYCPICKEDVPKDEWFILDWSGNDPPPSEEFGEAKNTYGSFRAIKSLTGWSGFY